MKPHQLQNVINQILFRIKHQVVLSEMSDEELSRLILSLNAKQRKIFNIVRDWSKKKLKLKFSNKRVYLLRLAITGGVVVGNNVIYISCWCHLAKSVSSYLIKTFSFHSGSLEKQKILSLAPASVAAINSDVTTFNTNRSINTNTPSVFGKNSRYRKIKVAM